jgi:hypothetical protein
MLAEPADIAAFRMRFHLPEQLNHGRLEARLSGIGIGNDRFDIDGDNKTIGSDQPRASDSMAWQLHNAHSSK